MSATHLETRRKLDRLESATAELRSSLQARGAGWLAQSPQQFSLDLSREDRFENWGYPLTTRPDLRSRSPESRKAAFRQRSEEELISAVEELGQISNRIHEVRNKICSSARYYNSVLESNRERASSITEHPSDSSNQRPCSEPPVRTNAFSAPSGRTPESGVRPTFEPLPPPALRGHYGEPSFKRPRV